MTAEIRPDDSLMRVLSLCSGIGGLDLGLKRACPAAKTVCYVEKKEHARKVLAARMLDGLLDVAPLVPDLRNFYGGPWIGRVDCVAAGFPCQPFSTASRGRKVAFDLWPECRRIVGECLPRFVFCENVQRSPICRAAEDLADRGYRCAFGKFSAADVGAAHQRDRWWLLADLDDAKQPAQSVDVEVAGVSPALPSVQWQEIYGGILGVDVRAPGTMDRLNLLGESAMPAVAALAWQVLSSNL